MYRYSVIIADDEIANVRGVSRLLERECPEVRVVGTYDNGKSVIEHLEREPVDIAILDIKMPEATGMEVATWIFEKRLDTSVILMTGYREFEYAKQAVNVGVEAFWEKPLNLKEAVAKLKDICHRKACQVQEQIRLSHNIVLQNEKLNQDLRLYYFGVYDFATLREKYAGEYALDGKCAIVEFQLAAGETRDENDWKGIAQIENEQFSSFLLTADESCAKFLVLVASGDIRPLATKYAEEIKKLLNFPGEAECTYSIEWYESLREITLKQQREIAALVLDELLFTRQKQSDILQVIGYYSPHLIKEFVRFFLQQVAEKTNIDSEKYRALAAGITNKKELFALIDEIETELLQQVAEDNRDIENIEEYIRNNCARDISLHEVAEKFNFNYSYLSRLFKKNTRMNFSDYLVYLRIEKAKGYLLSGYKTDEVAQMVGYNKAAYFRELFKKQTGMTPSQYVMLKKIAKNDV